MKTILCHVQDDEGLGSRLDCALALARAASAHLTCVHVTPVDAYVTNDAFGVAAMPMVVDILGEQQERARARIEQRLASEDVRWDFRRSRGPLVSQLASEAALADLVIVSRGSGPALLGELLQRSRPPLFIPGDEARGFDPLGSALIAWNGSYEAANAVRSAVGLLRLAADVTVLTLAEDRERDQPFPSTRLLEYLSRYDIHAELKVEPLERGRAADMLAAEALRLDAAYLVMGGYGHSRLNEFIFGGVTRALLTASPVALLTTH